MECGFINCTKPKCPAVKTVGHGMCTTIAQHAGGIAIQSVVATGVASHKTVKHRRQGKRHKKQGALPDFPEQKPIGK